MSKTLLWVFVAVVVIGGGLWWWSASQNVATAPSQTATQTQLPATPTSPAAQQGQQTAVVNTSQNQTLQSLPSGNSDQSINQDLMSINSQMNGLNSDTAGMNQSFNDQQVQQAQF